MNIATDELDNKEILSQLNDIELLDDYIDWLYKLIDVYARYISIRNSSIDLEFISKIKEYISNNINNQISLNSVAEHFKVNACHLSTLFKKGTGINFSNFIVNKKLEKAAELLVGQNNREINEIADSIGYSNTTYFTGLFKEKYGMTPMQYKKKNA